MKWRFWKRSSKSKTAKAKKGKRQQKPEDCTECDSLRTIVDGEFVVLFSLEKFNFVEVGTMALIIIKPIIIYFSFVAQSSEAIVTKWFSSNRSWTRCMISSSRK